MPRLPPTLASTLAALLALAPLAGEDVPPQPDPLVTTTWEVRQAAAEVIAALRRRSDIPVTLERVRELLAQHGDDLIQTTTGFVPLADAIAVELAANDLAATYAKSYTIAAEQALAGLSAGAGAEALRRVARTYPGTPSAAEAWRRLADRSWDYGHLGTYLGVAQAAGDAADPDRLRRIQAARDLVAIQHPIQLPDTLELAEMWRMDLPAAAAPAGPVRRARGVPTATTGYVLSATDGDLTAASDGLTCFVFDHLVGRRIGEMHSIGRYPMPPASCRPAVWSGGFAALGQDRVGAPMLTAIDRLGRQRWRVPLGTEAGGLSSASAPVIIDDVVVVAALGANEDGPELRVIAHHLDDGRPVWDRFVAKLPVLLGRQMFFDESMLGGPPLLVRHGGGLLLLPSTGLLAQLDGLGTVRRIWTYASLRGNEDRFNRRQTTPRSPGLVSDGRWAVATPADAEGLTWILPPDGSTPTAYQSDGARGTVVALRDGKALLTGKQTTLIDCATSAPIWHHTVGVDDPSGRLGERTALIAGKERLTLLDVGTGNLISDRTSDPPLAFAACDGMLVVAGREALVAYGNAERFIAEQQAAIARNPKDHRAYVALGKIWAAQGKQSEAYDHLVMGLERGAPVEYASTAARLVRDQLEGTVDDAQAFPAMLARFERLRPFAPGLASEADYWRARHAEAGGRLAEAIAAYRQVLAGPGTVIELGGGRDARFEASLSALADIGLSRAGKTALPPWITALPKPLAPARPEAWNAETSRARNVLLSGDLILGYEGGRLTARSAVDGALRWARIPDLRLLGVRAAQMEANHPGVPIEVLDGTAAAAAGLRTGDIMTTFNDLPIRDFRRDLVPAVADSAEGAPFTVTVMRGNDRLTCTGTLGGELVEAIAADDDVVLAWPVVPMAGRGGRGEGMWVSVLSRTDGSERLRWPLPPLTADRLPPKPLLAPGGIMIASDGEDLVAIDLARDATARERWRAQGQAAYLDQAHLISQGGVLIGEPTLGRFRLLDLRSGATLLTVSADPDTAPLLSGGNLIIKGSDGRAACWELGTGRLRWRSEQPVHRLIAAEGDAVFIADQRKRLHILDRASGRIRRTYGDWASVDDLVHASDRLVMSVRRGDGSRAVAAISVPAGAPLFERVLPRNTEIREFHASSGGCLLVLAEAGQRPATLGLDAQGNIASARHLSDNESVVPLSHGYLIGGTTSIAGVPNSLEDIPVGAPLSVPQVAEAVSLQATIQQVEDQLPWQNLDGGAYAILGVGRSLVVVARLPVGVEVIQVRIGTGSSPLDTANQVLTFQRHRVARFTDLDDGWRLGAGKKLPSTDNAWIFAARIDPPVSLAPGMPLAIRATQGEDLSSPWWLRRSWRSLVTPVDPLAPMTPPPAQILQPPAPAVP